MHVIDVLPPALPPVCIQNSHPSSLQRGFCSSVGRALVYRDPGSRVQFPAGGLGVAFFATGPRLGLKMYIFLTLEFTLL